jgi:signal transduction histidine kinase
MEQGINRLNQISASLRIFSRSDLKHQVPFDLNEGLESTLLILQHRLKANQHRPDIQVIKKYGDLPKVNCFPGPLNQVFMNLLANAIDALDECMSDRADREISRKPLQIQIETEAIYPQVIVRISDRGVGMSEAVKQRIFEPGFTTKPVGKGTGLGMAIAHQIITEKHGGKIECESILGQGTVFKIALPMV